jgi:hypothetical protein
MRNYAKNYLRNSLSVKCLYVGRRLRNVTIGKDDQEGSFWTLSGFWPCAEIVIAAFMIIPNGPENTGFCFTGGMGNDY